MRLAVAVVAGLAIAVAGVLAGAWWTPFAAGLVIGLAEPKARLAMPLGAAAGLVGWLVPLVWAQIHYSLGPAAR
ncbi:MAG TPA: hypothetical protein VEW68_10875, partial [Patescibacteria group bacterium]|nr:hypothetical protein [Patescibacteria group bacterium]